MTKVKKRNYSIRENAYRIANSLELKNIQLELIYRSLCELCEKHSDKMDELRQAVREEYSIVKNGLSAICRNAYSNNIRTQEVIDFIKKMYPEEKDI